MRIVCTREEASNRALIDDFAREGLHAVSLPLITTKPLHLSAQEESKLLAALNDESCALCFTSQNGVRYAAGIIGPLVTSPRCTIAVQGHATAVAGESLIGCAPSLVAHGSTGVDLGKTILSCRPRITRALLIGPADPRPELASVLAEGGLSLERIAVYRTDSVVVSPDAKRAFAEMGECIVLFFSPSSVRSFVDADLDSMNQSALYACFGPTTATELRSVGLSVALEHRKGSQAEFTREVAELERSRQRHD